MPSETEKNKISNISKVNGYTIYYDIYRYLIKKRNSNKIIYPDYFDDFKTSELETKKRKFINFGIFYFYL